MSSSTRKKLLRTTSVVVNVGCSCRRPKIAAGFLRRRPKSSAPMFGKPNQLYQSSWSSWDRATTQSSYNGACPSSSTDFSPHYSSDISSAKKKASPSSSSSSRKTTAKGRIDESVAVEKESDDPYLDFRRSMLQMILEKEIYAEADLRELLNCFLALNSPYHHGVIIRAFTEIWNGARDMESSEMAVSWRRSRESRGTARGRGR